MYKVPVKYKRSIEQELKKFLPLINSLKARGKSSTEEDARVLLNDIFHCVLGYDKYNDLKTEMRDRAGRCDYVVQLSEGKGRKKDQFDFIVEAKAVSVELSTQAVDQTLSYCLTTGVDYFLLTNVVKWELYKISRKGKSPTVTLIHEVNLGTSNDHEALAYEMYLLSKASYLAGDWKDVSNLVKATKAEDVVAVLLSNKIVKMIARELSSLSDVKINDEIVRDIIENQIVKSEVSVINKKLLKKINETTPSRKSKALSSHKESCLEEARDDGETDSIVPIDRQDSELNKAS